MDIPELDRSASGFHDQGKILVVIATRHIKVHSGEGISSEGRLRYRMDPRIHMSYFSDALPVGLGLI